MENKRPSFQFYPSDWLRDTSLRSCSVKARGLWIDMICFMHQGNPYGHLCVGEKNITEKELSRMTGMNQKEIKKCLLELNRANVFGITKEGVIYSRRMVKDEHIRAIRSKSGSLGGNPILLNQKDNPIDNLALKQKPTPSSSSSIVSKDTTEKSGGVSRDELSHSPKQYGDPELNRMRVKILTTIGRSDFAESQKKQRQYLAHIRTLLSKDGKEVFDGRWAKFLDSKPELFSKVSSIYYALRSYKV